MINSARLTWLLQATQAAQQLLELRDTLENLSQQHFLSLYGDAVNGILDVDLQGQSQYANVTKAELDTWVSAINALITVIGAKSDGNTAAGSSLKLIG